MSTRRAAGRAFRQLDAEAAAPGEDRDVARSRARLRAIWPFQLLARAPASTVAAQATFARARGAVHAPSTARRRAIASRAIPSDPCRPPQPPHVLQSTVVGFDGMCSPVNWTPGPPHSARRASCRVGLVLGLHLSYDRRWALGLSLVSTWHPSTLPGCPTAACLFMPPSSRPRRGQAPNRADSRRRLLQLQLPTVAAPMKESTLNQRCAFTATRKSATKWLSVSDRLATSCHSVPALPLPGKRNLLHTQSRQQMGRAAFSRD